MQGIQVSCHKHANTAATLGLEDRKEPGAEVRTAPTSGPLQLLQWAGPLVQPRLARMLLELLGASS